MPEPFTPSGDGTVLLDRTGREMSYRRISVQVVAGADTGASAIADGGEISVGTNPGNDLVLTDPSVSRHHCVIAVRARGYQLSDLGSTNGTHVAGIGIDRAYLKPGTIVDLGQTKLRFDVLDDRVSEPLASEERWGRALGRSAGFSLDEMARMFGPNGRPRIDRNVPAAKADELDATIKRLSLMRKSLRHAANCPAPSHMECPVFRRMLRAAMSGDIAVGERNHL